MTNIYFIILKLWSLIMAFVKAKPNEYLVAVKSGKIINCGVAGST